jgi:hypothetical protein
MKSARAAGTDLTAELLLDNSAWSRLDEPAVAQDRGEQSRGGSSGGGSPPVSHYEIVSEKTDLRFDSLWLAPRGSI